MHLKRTLVSFCFGAALGVAGSALYVTAFLPAAESRAASVAAPSRFETFGLALPNLGVERIVRAYLPRGYSACEDCRYPVVYFMDGQNVFDAATSYAGEWGADEVLDALLDEHGLAVIAVAIDHGGEMRMQELSVWENPQFAPARGGAFLADLVATVKPAIDARYRTLPAAASTTIVGSSMGGLMAHAALMRHPGVFSRALVFSPSYWFSPAIADETMRTPLRAGQRVYIYTGAAEGDDMMASAQAMSERWNATRPEGAMLQFVSTDHAEHNETAWRAALPAALCWSFAPVCESR